MLPVLVDLGFIKIYTFGVFLMLAFFWGAFFVWKNTALTSYKEEEVFDGIFISIFGAAILGRIVHIALHFSDFGWDLSKFILINGYPGIHLFGFILGFLLFYYLFTAGKKISFSKSIDYLVAPLFLAIAIGKLGSFFSGSEIGSQTKFFLSLTYQNLDGQRHLTSLYESILFFLGSYFAYGLIFKIRQGKLQGGFGLAFFLWYFFLIELLFDPIKTFRSILTSDLPLVSLEMIISAVFLLTGTGYFIYHFRTLILEKLKFKPFLWRK